VKLALAGAGGVMLWGCTKKPMAAVDAGVAYYTCAMHTFVREKEPGKCPVCGMTLVAVMKGDADAMEAGGPAVFTVAADRQQEIGVTYAKVERRVLKRSLTGVGTVDYDKEKAWAFVARTDGYVKELYVASPGEVVGSGEKLLTFYSPDLFTAEREYVMLLGMQDAAGGSLLESARQRLKQWNVSDGEIAELDKTRKPAEEVTLYSPFRGVVRTVAAEQGGSVKAGDKLVEVADLSRVWVWAEFYESELAGVEKGQRVTVSVKAYPGVVFDGTVAVIDPFLDEGRRTFRVRVDIENQGMKLQPGMYADVTVDEMGGMGLTIPLNAVMPTGKRDVVFVDRGQGRLEPRAVVLGDEYDGSYEVKAGLAEGEKVVSSATFLIDAEAQLQGALQGLDAGPKGVMQ
jgi:Cu(I)/Ag(I) efflux system membrane fusion protein